MSKTNPKPCLPRLIACSEVVKLVRMMRKGMGTVAMTTHPQNQKEEKKQNSNASAQIFRFENRRPGTQLLTTQTGFGIAFVSSSLCSSREIGPLTAKIRRRFTPPMGGYVCVPRF